VAANRDIVIPIDEEDIVRNNEMLLEGISPQEAAIQIFLDRLSTLENNIKAAEFVERSTIKFIRRKP